MKMERAANAPEPIISSLGGGGFRIEDRHYPALLITPLTAESWAPPPLCNLAEADIAPLLSLDPLPEFLLIGTGAALRRPPSILIKAVEAHGLGIEAMDSRAAARAWGVLRGEGRWIAAALYPLDR